MAGQPGLSGGTAEEEPSLPRTPGAAPASRPPRLPPSRTLCWHLLRPSWPLRGFVPHPRAPHPHPVSTCPRPELGMEDSQPCPPGFLGSLSQQPGQRGWGGGVVGEGLLPA